MSVKEQIQAIKTQLPQEVTLVAVSKTKPNALLMEAYDAGQRDFGENYVQELEDKQKTLPSDIHWHFIGHLQSNKVKYIAPFVHLIHGVDSLKLLIEIDKQAQKCQRVIDCLLQIYIAKEESKFGLSFEECRELLNSDAFKKLRNIRIVGFMGMASNTDDENIIRSEFRSLHNFSKELSALPLPNFSCSIRSYGMSSDYKIALEEGSTMLRIGSTIFGSRDYSSK